MNRWAPSIDVYYSDTECLMLLLIHFPSNKSITHSHTATQFTYTHVKLILSYAWAKWAKCLTSSHTRCHCRKYVCSAWMRRIEWEKGGHCDYMDCDCYRAILWNIWRNQLWATMKTEQSLIEPPLDKCAGKNIHTFWTATTTITTILHIIRIQQQKYEIDTEISNP